MAFKWIENLYDKNKVGPTVIPGRFAAGASQAIAAHTLLERTGNTNTEWVPIDSDHDASTTKLAVKNEQPITSGDLTGDYEIISPQPGDVFEADLAAASAVAPETALYYSSATAITVTAGTNIIGYSVHGPNHPGLQNRLSQGQLGDKGTTYLSTNKVRFVFRQSYSINTKFQRD